MSDMKADGVLGLGPNKPQGYPHDTVMASLKTQGVINKDIFSLFLCRDGIQSSMWYGGYSIPQIRSSLESTMVADDVA